MDLANGFEINFDEAEGAQVFVVRLNDELGKRILFANPDTLADKDFFRELFKGFVFKTDPVQFFSREPGAIYTFNAGGVATQMELHYQKKDSSGVFEAASPEPFLISSSTPRFHSISRTDINDKLLTTEWNQPDDRTFVEFVQGGGLIQNFIQFPYVEDLGTIGVSRAQLIVKIDTSFWGSEGRYTPPTELLAVLADENKGELLDADGFRQPISSQSSSAVYNASEHAYIFTLTEYIQRISSGQLENTGFLLIPRNSSFLVNRAVLGGTTHPTLAPELKITFSTLPR